MWYLRHNFYLEFFPILQEKWKKFTKTSHRVRIERVRSRIKIGYYVTKYITKGIDIVMNTIDYIKIRKMQFFSTMGLDFSGKSEPYEKILCPHCGCKMTYDMALTDDAIRLLADLS